MADDCLKKFIELAPGAKGEARDLVREVRDEIARRVEENPDVPEGAHVADVLAEMADLEAKRAERVEAALITQFEARRQLTTQLRSNAAIKGFTARRAYVRTLETATGRANAARPASVDGFLRDLKENKLDDYLSGLRRDKQEQLNVIKELEQASSRDGKLGVSGSKEAKRFVEIYSAHMDALNARGEAAGVGAEMLDGWIMKQTWDAIQLRRFAEGTPDPAGTFAEAVLPHIDRKRTLGTEKASDAQVKRFLREFYTARIGDEIEDVPVALRDLEIQGTPTFGKRQLLERQIHMKSPESFQFVFDTFTADTLASSLMRSLETRAQRVTAVEQLGPNPERTVTFLQNETKRLANERGERLPFGGEGSVTQTALETVTRGMLHAAAGIDVVDTTSPSLAKLRVGLANWSRAAMLGRVVLYTPTEVITSRSAAGRAIRGLAKSNIEVSKRALSRVARLSRTLDPETFEMIRVGMNTAHAYKMGAEMSRMSGSGLGDRALNLSGDAMNATFKFSGMDGITERLKVRAGLTMNAVAAQLKGKSLDEMDDSLKEVFLRGGIGREEWDRIRAVDEAFVSVEQEGVPFMNVAALQKADPEMAERFLFMLRQFGDDAVVTPGVFERSILTAGTRPGTFSGEAMRLVADLLGWPVSFLSRGLARTARVDGMRGLAMLSVQMWAAGAVATMMNDFAQGRTRDYFSDDPEEQAKLLFEYATRGGLGGILGDFVAKSFDPQFGGPLESLAAAPALSMMDEVITGLGKTVIETGKGDFGEATFRFAETVEAAVPFTQLPQTSFFSQMMLDELGYALGGDAADAVKARKANLKGRGIEMIMDR